MVARSLKAAPPAFLQQAANHGINSSVPKVKVSRFGSRSNTLSAYSGVMICGTSRSPGSTGDGYSALPLTKMKYSQFDRSMKKARAGKPSDQVSEKTSKSTEITSGG